MRADCVLVLAMVFTGSVAAADLQTALRYHGYKDYDQAFAAFMELAQQGDATAQANVGYYYDNGLAVAKDLDEALRWYKIAAGNGSVEAQYNLGAMYESGDGVARDYTEAFKWLSMAAYQGDAHADAYLGLFFEEGLGRPVDVVQAYAWYRTAAVFGEPNSHQKLKDLKARMTAEQIDAGDALSAQQREAIYAAQERQKKDVKI